MSVIWHKVWFDLWNNKIRTLLAVVNIAVGVFAIGTTFGMANQISPTQHRRRGPRPRRIREAP